MSEGTSYTRLCYVSFHILFIALDFNPAGKELCIGFLVKQLLNFFLELGPLLPFLINVLNHIILYSLQHQSYELLQFLECLQCFFLI